MPNLAEILKDTESLALRFYEQSLEGRLRPFTQGWGITNPETRTALLEDLQNIDYHGFHSELSDDIIQAVRRVERAFVEKEAADPSFKRYMASFGHEETPGKDFAIAIAKDWNQAGHFTKELPETMREARAQESSYILPSMDRYSRFNLDHIFDHSTNPDELRHALYTEKFGKSGNMNGHQVFATLAPYADQLNAEERAIFDTFAQDYHRTVAAFEQKHGDEVETEMSTLLRANLDKAREAKLSSDLPPLTFLDGEGGLEAVEKQRPQRAGFNPLKWLKRGNGQEDSVLNAESGIEENVERPGILKKIGDRIRGMRRNTDSVVAETGHAIEDAGNEGHGFVPATSDELDGLDAGGKTVHSPESPELGQGDSGEEPGRGQKILTFVKKLSPFHQTLTAEELAAKEAAQAAKTVEKETRRAEKLAHREAAQARKRLNKEAQKRATEEGHLTGVDALVRDTGEQVTSAVREVKRTFSGSRPAAAPATGSVTGAQVAVVGGGGVATLAAVDHFTKAPFTAKIHQERGNVTVDGPKKKLQFENAASMVGGIGAMGWGLTEKLRSGASGFIGKF